VLPDLRRTGIVALDTETRDDRLSAKMGSGWPFGEGYVCGISVAYREENELRALTRRTSYPLSYFSGCAI
jgi:hypothetical protein